MKRVIYSILRQGLNIVTLMVSAMLVMSRINILVSEKFSNYALSVFAFTFPYFFLMALVLCILLLVYRKHKLLIYPALAMILTWGLATDTWAHGIRNTKEDKEETSLKVMTWNVGIQGIFTEEIDFYNNTVHKSIIKTIKEESPDLLCMQEYVGRDSEIDTSIYQVRRVAQEIDMPYFFYGYNPDFDIRRNSHYGKIIFSKYPIVYHQMVNFDSLKYNNSFEYVDVRIGSKIIRVATFHLQSLHLSGKARKITTDPNAIENSDTLLTYTKNIYDNILGSYQKRVKQAQAIRELINSTTYPLILCGDMNDVPSSYTYALLTEKLRDAFLCSGRGMGKSFESWIPNLRIDYILFSDNNINSKKTKVLHVPYSDHYPVVSEITL